MHGSPQQRLDPTNFERIKQSLCETCNLYILTGKGEYAVHVDAPEVSIGVARHSRMTGLNGCKGRPFMRRPESMVSGA